MGAVAAQLSPSARAANSLSAVAVGVAYVLRAMGDALGRPGGDAVSVASAWPSWLSPIGWGQQVRAFGDNNWWPLTLSILLFAGAVVVAVVLSSRRDFGQGMLPQRLGPTAAPSSLLRPLGLAWRMQRGMLAGWAVGMVALGGLFGSVGRQLEDLSSNEEFIEMLASLGTAGTSIADTFFAAAMMLVGAISVGYPLQAILRFEAQESDGRLEPVLATALSRIRWLLAHLAVTVVSTLVLLTLAGVAAGVVHGLLTGTLQAELQTLTLAALVQAPGVLALCGLAVAIFGLLPRWTTALTWTALTTGLLLGPLGETLGLPGWQRDVSPFTHTPAAPAVEITAGPVLLLAASAVLLVSIGTVAFNQRDLALRA